MEDRKRPAISISEDLAPPSKRQAVNGTKIKESSIEMKEETWIEKFSKGAIYREMQEYSRRAATFESRLEELHKRSAYHDDHLRIIDAWWRQVLEEMEMLADSTLPVSTTTPTDPPYLTRVHFSDLHDFQIHLEDQAKVIKARAEILLGRMASSRGSSQPDVTRLESTITGLLAAQKDYATKLDRLDAEKEILSEQLNVATLRYFRAEKKLDRAKSVQVQSLEQQALAHATKPGEASAGNVATDGNGAELMLRYEEVSAVGTKYKKLLDSILAELKCAQEENSAMKARREGLTDEDFIRTEVYKAFKSQHEDLIRRINHLEAINRLHKDELERFQAERITFRTQLELDAKQITQELEAESINRDQDLARLRSARDELLAENTQRKASQEQDRRSVHHMKELVAAKEDRIAALEAAILRIQPLSENNMEVDPELADGEADLEGLELDEVKRKYRELEHKYYLMNKEIWSMEKAYRKTMGIAQKKVMDFTALEDRVSLLIAEKSKADQKYFAARKDMDTKTQEIRALRIQNGKSADIITQLKEAEAQCRLLLANLEKQLVEVKKSNAAVSTEGRRQEVANTESSRRVEALKVQVSDMTTVLKSRDSAMAMARERNLILEADVERLKVRAEGLQKERDSWKGKALSNTSEDEEMLRTYALCTICRNNFKNTALKTCGHLFCSQCVDDRISNRMRKCPTCSRAFDKMDVMVVHH